jgi:hypothetical protein
LAYLVSQFRCTAAGERRGRQGHAYEEIVGANLRGTGASSSPRATFAAWLSPCSIREDQVILDPVRHRRFLITAMNHVIENIRRGELERWGTRSSGQKRLSVNV